MLAWRAAIIAARSRGLVLGSGAPCFADVVNSRMILVNTLFRFASCAPLRYMMFLNWEWPAILESILVPANQRGLVLPQSVGNTGHPSALASAPIWQDCGRFHASDGAKEVPNRHGDLVVKQDQFFNAWGCFARAAGSGVGQRRRQPAADPHRGDAPRQPGLVVGLREYGAEGARPHRCRQPFGRQLAGEALDRQRLLHADDRVVVAAHAGVGLIGRALGQ